MSRLSGKVIVISGASSGIGEYLAKELVARGARVGLLARREEQLRQLADEFNQGADTSTPVAAWRVADVTDDQQMESALDGFEEELGPVDVIVANAGYGHPENPYKHRPGASQAMYDTNLFGMLRMIDWALPKFMQRRAGHIVGVASVASFAGMPLSPTYCGSKAAMRIHLQGLRVTLAQHNIAVTTICPGFVESELTAKNKYKMPFMWKTDRAARKMADAIEKRQRQFVFPWQMSALVLIATRILPLSWFEGLMIRSQSKHRE